MRGPISHDCYEVKAADSKDVTVEMYVDPATAHLGPFLARFLLVSRCALGVAGPRLWPKHRPPGCGPLSRTMRELSWTECRGASRSSAQARWFPRHAQPVRRATR